MKTKLMTVVAAFACLSFTACGEKKTTTEEVKDKVGDALNTRPHEGVRDAAEDIEKDVKKAGEEIGEGIKDLGNDIKKEVNEATK